MIVRLILAALCAVLFASSADAGHGIITGIMLLTSTT
jgi:hypothetical protein